MSALLIFSFTFGNFPIHLFKQIEQMFVNRELYISHKSELDDKGIEQLESKKKKSKKCIIVYNIIIICHDLGYYIGLQIIVLGQIILLFNP